MLQLLGLFKSEKPEDHLSDLRFSRIYFLVSSTWQVFKNVVLLCVELNIKGIIGVMVSMFTHNQKFSLLDWGLAVCMNTSDKVEGEHIVFSVQF